MRRCLVLSSWYIPMRVADWQDAICAVYLNKADVIVSYDETVSSPSTSMNLPAVIRMRSTRARNKNSVKFSRQNVYARDNFTCQYCGKVCAFRELTYDHVVPKSRGGRREWTNIVTACRSCNDKKGDQSCDESGMFPRQNPVQPKSLPPSGLQIAREDAPIEWFDWIR
jgi:5-methylcytosine-specific restriction endonuclease McrA